ARGRESGFRQGDRRATGASKGAGSRGHGPAGIGDSRHFAGGHGKVGQVRGRALLLLGLVHRRSLNLSQRSPPRVLPLDAAVCSSYMLSFTFRVERLGPGPRFRTTRMNWTAAVAGPKLTSQSGPGLSSLVRSFFLMS